MQKIRGRLIAHFDGLDEKIKNRNKNLYHKTDLWKKVSSQYVHCNNKQSKNNNNHVPEGMIDVISLMEK